jgi:hypothetical protein
MYYSWGLPNCTTPGNPFTHILLAIASSNKKVFCQLEDYLWAYHPKSQDTQQTRGNQSSNWVERVEEVVPVV